MDGDSGPRKKYDFASHSTGADIGRSRPLHHPQDTSIHRFRESNQSSNSRLPHVDTVAQQNRNPSLHPYSGFEYAESTPYNAPSLQGGSLHSGTLPYQQDFSTSSSRQNPPQTTQQSGHQEQHQHQQQQQHQQQRMQQYDSGMVYNIAPQGQPQSPYDASSHYQPRHSAAIEVLATQFGVPQYYPADDTPAQESAQYLTSQVQQTPYSQAPSTNRSHIATSYPETMPGFNASVGSESVQPSEHRREPSSGLEDAYNQYHQALRQTFENISAGRLNTASRSLLEMSEWLLGNAVDLGLARDEEHLHADRIKLWDEFNTCWLALCQKQKDTAQSVFESGPSPQELLSEETLNKMGKDLVRLCDRIEQHGLVDYQMGVWEEEILSVLGQCLDLLEKYEDTNSTNRSQTGTAVR